MEITNEIKIIGSVKTGYENNFEVIKAGDIDFEISKDFTSEDEAIEYINNNDHLLSVDNIEDEFDIILDVETEILDGFITINGVLHCLFQEFGPWKIEKAFIG